MAFVEDMRDKSNHRGRLRYRAHWRDRDGKQRAKSFARKVDAERFLVSIEHAKHTGAYVDPHAGKLQVGEWAERWYGTTASLAPSTRKSYRILLDKYVIPRFGAMPLAAVDVMAVNEWLASLIADGKSASRIKHALIVLGQVLDSAVENKRIATNPARAKSIRRPKPTNFEAMFLTAEQVDALADAIREPYGVLILLAAYTGLRAGEIGALRVKRLDLLRGRVEVVETLSDVAGKLEFRQPKNGKTRTVALPRFLCERLGAYLADRLHGPDDLVFTARGGQPLRQGHFYYDSFKPALAAAGLPARTRFHDLRHTCASLLIKQGAHPKAIMEQLGHSSIVITMDRYGHLYDDDATELARKMDALYRSAHADPSLTEPPTTVVQMPTKQAAEQG